MRRLAAVFIVALLLSLCICACSCAKGKSPFSKATSNPAYVQGKNEGYGYGREQGQAQALDWYEDSQIPQKGGGEEEGEGIGDYEVGWKDGYRVGQMQGDYDQAAVEYYYEPKPGQAMIDNYTSGCSKSYREGWQSGYEAGYLDSYFD